MKFNCKHAAAIQRTIATLCLGCFIPLITWCEPSRAHQVTNTHQPELCNSSFNSECISVGDFPKKIYRDPRSHNLGYLGRLQVCGGYEEFSALPWADGRIPERCVGVLESLVRCRKWIINSFHHEMAALVCRSLSSVFDYESNNENSCIVSVPTRLHNMDIGTKLPLCSVFHGFDRSSRSVGALSRKCHSFSHPFLLAEHGNDLARAYENQQTCESNNPPVGRRFTVSLFGCVVGYCLAVWSLGLSNRFLRRFFLGLGVLGVVIGLSCWWITFAFPGSWCWRI